VKNRKQVIAALKRAGDGYQNAAAAIWDLVDGEKPLTLNNLLALRTRTYMAESEGQRARDEAIQLAGGSDD
jgi:hypothetical protein